MADKPLKLGKVQLRIMQVLWDEGEVTARRVTEVLSEVEPIAHSTVQTLMRTLEEKGAVGHEVRDRTFVFRAIRPREEVTETATRDLLSRVFGGSVYGLVSHLLTHEEVSSEEIGRLRELIEREGREAKQ
ncbi:MAG: blaI 10 [Capsulimonas sp.]|nr:blaI 10 [Capsulimonas sp.]